MLTENDLPTLKRLLIDILRRTTDERVRLELEQTAIPFVELGVSSLAALRFWIAIEDALAIEWDPADSLSDLTTIDAVAARLSTRG